MVPMLKVANPSIFSLNGEEFVLHTRLPTYINVLSPIVKDALYGCVVKVVKANLLAHLREEYVFGDLPKGFGMGLAFAVGIYIPRRHEVVVVDFVRLLLADAFNAVCKFVFKVVKC
jgi:hypothetical protein